MKRCHFSMTCTALLGIAVLAVTVSDDAFGFHHGVRRYAECEECYNDCYAVGHHAPFPGGRRALPAPVYFGNTYPEYLYGNPDIYAGFDEYDSDVEFVSPIIGKTPFHYNYHNRQYNNSQYYGKNWDKNWYITNHGYGENPANFVPDGGAAGVELRNEQPAEKTDETEINTDEAPSESRQSGNIIPVSYEMSPSEDAYRGRFICNFESFCDNDPPCALTCPVSGIFQNLLGNGCCGGIGADHAVCDEEFGGCCRAFSGHGGYGGFNCPEYRSGNDCALCPQYADGEYTADPIYIDDAASADLCVSYSGIYVDPCTGCDGGSFINDTNDAAADDAVVKTDTSEKESETKEEVNTETPKTDTVQTDDPAPEKASPQQPAVPDANSPAAEPKPENGDSFPELTDPVTDQAKSAEKRVGAIQMTVPANSLVFINGYRTKLTGTERTFVAKNLTPGEVYRFEIRVVAEKDGQIYTGVKETELRAGQSAEVAFRANDLKKDEELTYASK